MMRRNFLLTLAGTGAAWAATRVGAAPAARLTPADVEDMRRNWRALLRPEVQPPDLKQPFTQTAEEWKKRFKGLEYDVLREEGTERPFTSPLNDEKRAGVFACKG